VKRNKKKAKIKKWHDYRSRKIGKSPKRNKRYNPNKNPIYKRRRYEFVEAEPIVAPANICILKETEKSLNFFSELRRERNISKIGRICFVQIDISRVVEFDYSAICVLMAIVQDLKAKKIYVRGNFPDNKKCRDLIVESGLLTYMRDEKGKPFKKAEKSDLLFIEKGAKKLTREDNKQISDSLRKAAKYLTGEEKHLPKLRTILLEICGNSIEWGDTTNKEWLLGILYEDDKVTITITDVGKGILKTLNQKFKKVFMDTLSLKTDADILKGAFVQKYGSSTREINRNKGLPSIKNGFDTGVIKNLKVLTNNVLVDFEDDTKTRIMRRGVFKGTLYCWEVTNETIKKAI